MIPNEYRENQQFQLSVISELFDDLLEVPLASGNRVANDKPRHRRLIEQLGLGEPVKQLPDPVEYAIRYLYYLSTGQLQHKEDILGRYTESERQKVNEHFKLRIESFQSRNSWRYQTTYQTT